MGAGRPKKELSILPVSWDSGKMLYQYDISKFMAIDSNKEIIFHIPNEIDIDYVSNKKVLLSQYSEVEIEYQHNRSFHRVICTKFN
jgi:hypothetical protein